MLSTKTAVIYITLIFTVPTSYALYVKDLMKEKITQRIKRVYKTEDCIYQRLHNLNTEYLVGVILLKERSRRTSVYNRWMLLTASTTYWKFLY